MSIELFGREIALQKKAEQKIITQQLEKRGIQPCLCIIRDSQNPVIEKYVTLKKKYGADIGIEVNDILTSPENLAAEIERANQDSNIHGIILQFPISQPERATELTALIASQKDVDGLNETQSDFVSATATAILWFLEGNKINLVNKKIALVGYGRLIGRPLEKIFQSHQYNFQIFRSADEARLATELINFDVIISATGQPSLIKSDMLKDGAIVVDAGTASEQGKIIGDVSDSARRRSDLQISAKFGGVGPLTITVLFEHTLQAAQKQLKKE